MTVTDPCGATSATLRACPLIDNVVRANRTGSGVDLVGTRNEPIERNEGLLIVRRAGGDGSGPLLFRRNPDYPIEIGQGR